MSRVKGLNMPGVGGGKRGKFRRRSVEGLKCCCGECHACRDRVKRRDVRRVRGHGMH